MQFLSRRIFRRVAHRFSLCPAALLLGFSLLALSLIPNLSAESPHVGPAPAVSPTPPPELTEARKNEIRSEELFRRQVAKELASAEDKGSSWWSVLNSSFALWFLSSVVISGLTAAVALYQKRHADEKQKTDLQTRLATEISYRINNGLIAMHLDEKRVAAGNIYTQQVLYGEALSYLDNRVYSGSTLLDFSIYQDYKTRRFLSLLFELRSATDTELHSEIQKANADYTALEALVDLAAIQNQPASQPASITAITQSITHLGKLRDNPIWQELA